MISVESLKEELLERFYNDRWLCHQRVFPHRHPDRSPPAHRALVNKVYAPHPRQLIEGFRGLAKSTYLEEAAVVRAIFKEFHNLVIVGSSLERACERLAAIKNEFIVNEELLALVGEQRGETWQERRIVLVNGVCIQALGRDQSMTGMKHLDWRPDAALIDDVEDPEEVRTDSDRLATWTWLLKTFLPSLDHPEKSWVRVLGTRRGVGSLPERLEAAGWPTAKFPIEYIDDAGMRRATWPAKFPLDSIDRMKAMYVGDLHTWAQEYLCQASSEVDRVFSRSMFRTESRQSTWQATYVMIDPARTTNRTSATTGFAVWSWISNRLIVWAAGASMLKPDEILELIFMLARDYNPVWIGVERNSLDEFIMQPLRHEQMKRGISLPIKGELAPRSKLDFIRGLQKFFAAGEVIFAKPLPELENQLLSFPNGRIDAPNALAYALTMRPAAPIYEVLDPDCIEAELRTDPQSPLYVAANATGALTTAVLCQQIKGELRIYRDWVFEGTPDENVPLIQAEAGMEGDAGMGRPPRARDLAEALKLPSNLPVMRRMPIRWVVPPHHGDAWSNVGLEQAIRRLPATVSRGSLASSGRTSLRDRLSRRARGLVISEQAAWVLRAFAGGYSRAVNKGGGISQEAETGIYRTLIEGLESLVGMSASVSDDEDESNSQPMAWNRHGQSYRSALPDGRR